MAPADIRVELAYSPQAGKVLRLALTLPAGSTLDDAVQASGWSAAHPELQSTTPGIWGRNAQPGDVLRDGDRVEFYRPLTADPKESRRRRQSALREQRGGEAPSRHRPRGSAR